MVDKVLVQSEYILQIVLITRGCFQGVLSTLKLYFKVLSGSYNFKKYFDSQKMDLQGNSISKVSKSGILAFSLSTAIAKLFPKLFFCQDAFIYRTVHT